MRSAIINKVTAPWSAELVTKLNDMQTDDRRHAYTCPGNHEVCKNHRTLRATRAGWVCHCGDYKQDWVVWHEPL